MSYGPKWWMQFISFGVSSMPKKVSRKFSLVTVGSLALLGSGIAGAQMDSPHSGRMAQSESKRF
jgi:hypothetical protein